MIGLVTLISNGELTALPLKQHNVVLYDNDDWHDVKKGWPLSSEKRYRRTLGGKRNSPSVFPMLRW